MKRVLFIVALIAMANIANGQSGTYQKDAKGTKNCFDEYYESFMSRGAEVVPDGEHEVVFSIRTDTSCFCGEGKITVKDGAIVPSFMVKKTDGTYEAARKSLHPKTGQGDNSLRNVFTVENGMSQSFLTDDYYTVNLFFTKYLKRKVVPNQAAPNPNDISGVQIELTPKEKEIVMKAYEGLKFETGKAAIKPSSFPHLDLLATLMIEKPAYKLNLHGYTDNVGKAETNLTLSKNRANAVKDYLVKKGIDASRITAEGFGMENPIGDNKTADGRAKNRRVDFIMAQ
jgi:outer membrane protein OmpA-like peptidoglycan-associated protein